jgi:hypothetical protein
MPGTRPLCGDVADARLRRCANSRAQHTTRFPGPAEHEKGGAPVTRFVRGPRRGASHFAGRASVARHIAPFSAMTGSATRACGEPRLAAATLGSFSLKHRPSVAFGACRAWAPARRPAVASSVCRPRTASATSGRLDGLLAGWSALLRGALPEGAPLENVRKHARSVGGTFSRTARPPVRPNSFSVSRVREPGTAEEDSAYLRPQGGRRMPGTRPSCPWRETLLVREFTCSAGPVILVLRGAREIARTGDALRSGPTARCQSAAGRASVAGLPILFQR